MLDKSNLFDLSNIYGFCFSKVYSVVYFQLVVEMQEFVRISLILCFFGFLIEFRPNEPYITEFLDGPWNNRNLTKEQIERDVYPVGTYSYLALLVVVFLITDFLR